jgi:hypothetical protein
MNLFVRLSSFAIVTLLSAAQARALDLDWSGQFRTETHWLYGYSGGEANQGNSATQAAGNGYYVPGGGEKNAYFQTLFMKLRPNVIVNDNVSIKSEIWFNDPIYGIAGNAAPYPKDQRYWYSNSSRGSSVTAQRFWAEMLTDFGTVQAGRMPLNWGLGLVWNQGENFSDRYNTTADGLRLVSKFGSFTLSPGFLKYSQGDSLGGGCAAGGVCTSSTLGGGYVSEYSLLLKYENLEDDMELGVNFLRRLLGSNQSAAGYLGLQDAATGANYGIWDIYGSKKIGRLSIAGEMPIANGNIGPVRYSTLAVALETRYKFSDSFDAFVKAGRAPGQSNSTTATPDQFKGFYFNPNYRLGLIMFNYQLRNIGRLTTQNNPLNGAQSLQSPFDHPVFNAQYVNFGAQYRTGKWSFRTNWLFASAQEVADASTAFFFNAWDRQNRAYTAGASPQKKGLGWEMDFGTSFQWDDNFRLDWDMGLYFPGDFYKFSNTTVENAPTSVFANVFRVGINF